MDWRHNPIGILRRVTDKLICNPLTVVEHRDSPLHKHTGYIGRVIQGSVTALLYGIGGKLDAFKEGYGSPHLFHWINDLAERRDIFESGVDGYVKHIIHFVVNAILVARRILALFSSGKHIGVCPVISQIGDPGGVKIPYRLMITGKPIYLPPT